jgi:hypothetical protein
MWSFITSSFWSVTMCASLKLYRALRWLIVSKNKALAEVLHLIDTEQNPLRPAVVLNVVRVIAVPVSDPLMP